MDNSFTNNGAFMGLTGNIPMGEGMGNLSHHVTFTGDPAGGIMKAHDTFLYGSQKVNVSGPQYNNLNSFGNDFNPGPQACQAFRSIFDK